ncbi:hypothetical protein TNCV_2436951 [Trichonephila clavipes]|nr:hypothetical protein TNCV_2436951 [Trichonephila clavipes]
MDAVICFNDGYVSRIKVFEALGIKSGYNTERALLIIDNKRIFEAERIVNKVSLEARNKRRSLKRKMDKQNLDEENEYQSGEILIKSIIFTQFGVLEVACPLRKPNVEGSTPAGVNRFSRCENRRIMWHVKDSLSINLAQVLLAKSNHGNI